MFWDNFWPGLWANAIAALVGVAAGVPIALWIDRRVRARGRRAQETAQAGRLRNALEALATAIEGNVAFLKRLSVAVAQREVPLDIGVNVSVWEAVHPDIVSLIDDPKLQVDLATYFEDLQEIARLQRHLLDVVAGIGASMSGSETIRDKLFGILDEGSRGLLERSTGLLERIGARKSPP